VLLCCAVAQTGKSAPGDRIKVGAYQVEMAQQGSGRYAGIFESGFGTGMKAWRKVAPELATSARAFAARHPEQVAGMVLVDPSDEGFNPALLVVLTSVWQAEKPMFFLESVEAVAIKRDLHAAFLRQFSEGSQVLTLKSGHHIQLEEPELVVAAMTR
jgi:pimeloyl-ACP methyl ester carboxylesterase